ncbi:MAG: pantoate--beta-alanine ligase [Deltaproteobacteria bacterium]|nr:pantoate--beta-alanine ligase [Deltaproteobacteria bacterium]
MKLITSIQEMRSFSSDAKKSGKSIAFVPTMGCLHGGHASLLKKGKELCDILVMSIFVNPIQFGPKEDYASYPRDLKRDLAIAEANKADVVFNPAAEAMYAQDFQTYIDVACLSKHLCGISRHAHFKGVATVVAKLFAIVQANIAIFGEKDYQQLLIIKAMVKDLNIDVDVVGMPIARELDGLAMSSRNNYLNNDERKAALCLHAALMKGKELFENNVKKPNIILQEMRNIIEAEPLAVVDYINVCDVNTLEDLDKIQDSALLALAVKIGKVRLIDNCILG